MRISARIRGYRRPRPQLSWPANAGHPGDTAALFEISHAETRSRGEEKNLRGSAPPRESFSAMCRTQLGDPHSRAMTICFEHTFRIRKIICFAPLELPVAVTISVFGKVVERGCR